LASLPPGRCPPVSPSAGTPLAFLPLVGPKAAATQNGPPETSLPQAIGRTVPLLCIRCSSTCRVGVCPSTATRGMFMRSMASPNNSRAGLLALGALLLTTIVTHAVVQTGAAEQPSPKAEIGNDRTPAVVVQKPSISRTPEGLPLGGRKAQVLEQIRAKWGSDYLPINSVWDSRWYPRATRTAFARFLPRRCGFGPAVAPICEGTVVRSSTASMIEVVSFRDRVFRISIALPEAPDYRLQSQHMMDLLRAKYGPPAQAARWRDEATELTFDNLVSGLPALLHYTDIRHSAEADRAAQKFIEEEVARVRQKSMRAPKEY
jgi:hypothetical protein